MRGWYEIWYIKISTSHRQTLVSKLRKLWMIIIILTAPQCRTITLCSLKSWAQQKKSHKRNSTLEEKGSFTLTTASPLPYFLPTKENANANYGRKVPRIVIRQFFSLETELAWAEWYWTTLHLWKVLSMCIKCNKRKWGCIILKLSTLPSWLSARSLSRCAGENESILLASINIAGLVKQKSSLKFQ